VLKFDLNKFYSLLEVFDRTGRLLFPNEWTGEEAWARQVGDPKTSLEEREVLKQQILELKGIEPPIGLLLGQGFQEEELEQEPSDSGAIIASQRNTRAMLARLPRDMGLWKADHAIYSRRKTVESELFDAFDAGEMKVQLGSSLIADWRSWSQYGGFKVYYGLSMLRIPHQAYLNGRRRPGFVRKVEFALWARKFATESSPGLDTETEDVVELWFQREVESANHQRFLKDDMWERAREIFSELSQRAFNRIWDNNAPKAWKSGGRRG
jgi:hypothetical protein